MTRAARRVRRWPYAHNRSSLDKTGSGRRETGSMRADRCGSSRAAGNASDLGACLSASLRDRLPMLVQTGTQFVRGCMACGGLRGDGDVDRRQCFLVQTKGLARETLDAIARDRGAEDPRGDRKPQTRMADLICENGQDEIRIGESPATLFDRTKFSRQMQSFGRLERQFADRSSVLDGRYGQSRLRPLARRRASRRRPLLVAIRARKPWVRARCRLLGFNVRFIAGKPTSQPKTSGKNNNLGHLRKAARVLSMDGCVNRRPLRLELDFVPFR